MHEFTTKQRRAIGNTGNILVSAAAGSGKTRVLTERICNILSSGKAGIDEILVLTFTDAAAAEMKSRIYLRLFDMSISAKDESLGIIAEQVTKADISTIHSFCQKIVREKYFALGISPSFRVGSEKECNSLLKKSLSELLEQKILEKDSDIINLYSKYGKRNVKDLTDIVLNLYSELIVHPEPEEYRNNILKNYSDDKYKSNLESILKRDVELSIRYSAEILSSLVSLSRKLEMSKAESLLTEYLCELENHENIFQTKPYEEYKSLSFMISTFRIEKIDEEVKGVFSTNKEYIKRVIDKTKDIKALMNFDDEFASELEIVKNDSSILLSLAFELGKRYQEKKTRLNILDFNDLEHFAYRILKTGDNARSFEYKYIFIDEYQDTNPIQEAIITKIKKEDNLFMVGDIKQSVYAFRHAEPGIFLKKQNVYNEFQEEKMGSQDELIRMNENFRSSPVVVDAINELMSCLLTPDFGSIDYKNKESLVHRSILSGGKVGISIIDMDKKIYGATDTGDRLTSKEAEAFAVANNIHEILGQDFLHRESGLTKKIDYSDIVILLREIRQTGPVYKRVFESCGIPVDCEIKSQGTPIPETDIFANLLKVILNPTDDIALLSVMKYEYFGFSADDLTAIRAKTLDRKISFYECTRIYSEQENDFLSDKIDSFYDELKVLRQKSKTLPKEEFLDHCMSKLCFEEFFGSRPKRSLKADILRGYVASLVSETPETAGLSRIVEFINSLRKSGDSLDIQANIKSENSVRIMTIHKSKGLEFPVVFVSGLDKGFMRENKSACVIDKDMGLGFKLFNPMENFRKTGLIYQGILEKKKIKSLEEEIRILYVAMTRAENRLYFVGTRSSLKKSIERWLMKGPASRYFASSFMDLIMPIIINRANFAEGFTISRFLPPVISDFDSIDVILKPKENFKGRSELDRKSVFEGFLSTPKKEISLGYKYPFAPSLLIPSKKSVSSLNENEKKEQAKRKQVEISDLVDSSLNAAERGTAFHVFMQHVDFSIQDESEVKKQIASLLKKNIITYEEAKTLDTGKILNVLSSDIIKRASKAETLYREKNFTLKAKSEDIGLASGESVLIQGTIDLCFLEEDGFVVVDYKTDRGNRETIESRKEAYKKQVETYAKAIEKITRKPVKEKYLYFLNSSLYKV